MADLRPMDAGEILDGALNLYRRHFRLFFAIGASCLVVPMAVLMYFQVRVGTLEPTQQLAVMQANAASFGFAALIGGLLYAAGMQALVGASIHVISSSLLGRTPRYGDALRLGMARIGPLFLVALGRGIMVFLVMLVAGIATALFVGVAESVAGGPAAVLTVIVGVAGTAWAGAYVWCGYGVTSPVIVLETLDGSSRAFGRSWALTRGQRGKVFGVMFVAFLLAQFLPGIVLGGVSAIVRASSPEWLPAVYAVSMLMTLALAPVASSVLTLLYYDLRVRREGMDLEYLSRQLGLAPA